MAQAQAQPRQGGTDLTPVVILVGGIFLIVWNKIFGKDKEDKANEQKSGQLETGDYWSPSFWKQTKPPAGYEVPILKMATASEYAKQIYDSEGIFNDCETCLYDVFRKMNYFPQISFLAEVFSIKYKKDLFQYIKGFSNEEERATIFDIVSKYKYFRAKKK
jgi:hypothetical protein